MLPGQRALRHAHHLASDLQIQVLRLRGALVRSQEAVHALRHLVVLPSFRGGQHGELVRRIASCLYLPYVPCSDLCSCVFLAHQPRPNFSSPLWAHRPRHLCGFFPSIRVRGACSCLFASRCWARCPSRASCGCSMRRALELRLGFNGAKKFHVRRSWHSATSFMR